ncbi:hypothetical protein [Propionicicella superfundia]|uniref:hypothetical protein n=1 Tax=Propionicicella superfundia TaxID=348582 RepID=UPI00040A7FAB|nr:hypothetical protein [Propionicicella superfundia]
MCDVTNMGCHLSEGLAEAFAKATESATSAVLSTLSKALGGLGAAWVEVPTPTLTGGTGSSGPTSPAPGTDPLSTVLSWVTWIGLAIAIGSVMVLGARMVIAHRHGRDARLGRAGVVVGAVALISGASGIGSALVGSEPACEKKWCASETVGYLQAGIWPYMLMLVAISVIVAAATMLWTQRVQPLVDLAKSLVRLIVVSGAGIAIVALLTEAADAFSLWILNGALECDISDASKGCFAGGMGKVVLLATPAASGLGPLLLIVLSLVAMLASLAQIGLMLLRGAMLVILAATLPAAAAAANTKLGQAWWTKSVGWLAAFILYKPAAAIVYAAALKLVGSGWSGDNAIVSVSAGLVLMLLALVALPALMRFTVPAVASTAGGAATAALLELPTGAASTERPSARSASSSPRGSDGATGRSAPTGSAGAAGAAGPAGAAASAGASTAGGAAASGAAAAAGPVGAAVAVGRKVVGGAQAVAKIAKGAVEDTTGETS